MQTGARARQKTDIIDTVQEDARKRQCSYYNLAGSARGGPLTANQINDAALPASCCTQVDHVQL
jgi:hypothetical protein